MGLSEQQRKQCEQPLSKEAVKTRDQGGQKLSYVDGHYAVTRANEVFGYDGWSYAVRDIREVYRGTKGPGADANAILVFEAVVCVSAGGVTREDVGVGQCDASPRALAQGIEKGRKEAVTDALKRALRTFGPSFGLALYDKAQADVVDLPTEVIDALDALASSTSPDGWVKSHKVLLAELGPAQKSHVWERVKARKEELAAAPPEEPPPDGTTTPSKARKGTTTAEGSAVASTGTGGAPKASARGPVVLPDWAFSRDAIRVHAASDWSCKPHAENSVRLWGAFVPGLAEVASSWLQARGYDEATADGMTAVWSKEGPRPRTVKATRKGRKAA